MSLATFNTKWCSSSYPPKSVSEMQIQSAEQLLGARFPDDYRDMILNTGLPRPTIALLDAIVEHALNLPDLSNFHSTDEIVEQTLGWHGAGMPEHLIAFASDGGGNQLCFDRERLANSTQDRNAVWFFDHDFDTTEMISRSFTELIAMYCAIEPWPGTELG